MVLLACMLSVVPLRAIAQKPPSYPTFNYEIVHAHEIKPHRSNIPMEGVSPGFNQLRLRLTVSPTGDVIDADASSGYPNVLKYWLQVEPEVRQWKFIPFEKDGSAVTADIEEYVNLVPPERLPKVHVTAPILRSDSKVTITLQRSRCFGSCPAYTVTVSTDGIVFDGQSSVVAPDKHLEPIDPNEVRKLAKKFVAADFYSMDSSYIAGVTDNSTYLLSIEIDGQKKDVKDYVGSWQGMPAVITDLEDEVDVFARTERWVKGSDGLVQALQAGKYNFQTFEAQTVLKDAAGRGQTTTVKDLLRAGVPLQPLTAPQPKAPSTRIPYQNVGWLNAASRHPDVLHVLLDAGASKDDQSDKDFALVSAAHSGSIQAVRALIAYGANPNANLSKLIVTTNGGNKTMQEQGAGSVLINAAESGNPDVVREILRYHPDMQKRDAQGQTAIIEAAETHYGDPDVSRVECVRLLVQAGANVNDRDNRGNTPLHVTSLTALEEELLKLGADVNARNKDGETPIFTTFDDKVILLYIQHGADLTIRNNKGQTVFEAAPFHGPQRIDVLRKAIQEAAQH